MTRLSDGMTTWHRYGVPLCFIMGAGALFMVRRGIPGVVMIFFGLGMAVSIWFGLRLSDVSLDGDELEVKGRATVRVPLALVASYRTENWGRGLRVFVLVLAQPVNNVRAIRFLPRSANVEEDLKARILAAQAAPKA